MSLIIAGFNHEPKLYETDPSGTPTEWKATALGEGRNDAMTIFEKEYSEGMSVDDTLQLAIKAMNKVMKKKPEAKKIEATVIDKNGFRKLSEKEIETHLEKSKK